MHTAEISLDLVLALDGAALEVRRLELLDLLIEFTGAPPENVPSDVILEQARTLSLRRTWILDALSRMGPPEEEELVRSKMEHLKRLEQKWAQELARCAGFDPNAEGRPEHLPRGHVVALQVLHASEDRQARRRATTRCNSPAA